MLTPPRRIDLQVFKGQYKPTPTTIYVQYHTASAPTDDSNQFTYILGGAMARRYFMEKFKYSLLVLYVKGDIALRKTAY